MFCWAWLILLFDKDVCLFHSELLRKRKRGLEALRKIPSIKEIEEGEKCRKWNIFTWLYLWFYSRSHSRSPTRKYLSSHLLSKKTKAPSPPSPPRIRATSPGSSRGSHKKRTRDTLSPSTNGSKYPVSPIRLPKHRLSTPSPPRTSKYGRNKSPSPMKYRLSPQHSPRMRYRDHSPEVPSKKHRHKHKY